MLAPRDMQCVDYIHYNEIAKYRIGKQGVIFDLIEIEKSTQPNYWAKAKT